MNDIKSHFITFSRGVTVITELDSSYLQRDFYLFINKWNFLEGFLSIKINGHSIDFYLIIHISTCSMQYSTLPQVLTLFHPGLAKNCQ